MGSTGGGRVGKGEGAPWEHPAGGGLGTEEITES